MRGLLSNDDHLQVLACIEALHQCRSLEKFPANALRAFSTLIPSNLAGFNEVNLPRNRLLAIMDKPVADHARFAARWEKYAVQHPLVNYVKETGDGQAVKISDFLSAREYHALDLYREVFKPLDAQDQMSVTIRSDKGSLIAIAFNRAQRSFTEVERMKLNLVRPHLLQAYANAEEFSTLAEERDDLMTALRETGHGVITLSAAGTPSSATPGALDCLARYFPGESQNGSIPKSVIEWFTNDSATSFSVRAAKSRLIIRMPRGTKNRLLFLSEENDLPLPGASSLTTRETEVLRWIAMGKTNAEIAIILGIAQGTAKVHVEHILAKLGVDNRTSATVIACERGLVSPSEIQARP